MRPQPARDKAGFTLAELMIVMGTIAVLATLSGFLFLNYLNSATLRGGVDELATVIGRGRQLAIAQNSKVCVEQAGSIVRYHIATNNPCNAAVWIGTGTSGDGSIALSNTVEVSATTANVVFNRLGGAETAGTYTVRYPPTGQTATVVVSSSGRVTVNAP